MENHLIIGLGGTGGRVISAFRKIVHEKLHGNLKPEWLWLDYVYVDSSEPDLKMDDPVFWNVMGQSIRLDESSLVSIPPSNLSQFIENKNRYKYLEPWLGDETMWYNIIRDPKNTKGAAGQKRRLGRLLFANGASRFNETVGTKVTSLKTNPQGQQVNFHIIAGLAGGTGSGSIIDAVAQIRKEYPDVNNYKIFLYLLLPEDGKTSWATTPNYMPNGYVALTELNAMEMGEFKPWDVGERQYEVKRLKQKLPFYSAYLVTNENSQNVSFNVETTVPASIAEFIFQKTVGLAINEQRTSEGNGQTKDITEFFDRAERGENPDYEGYNKYFSHNFMTFGIKRFAIPEVEIQEYFGYNFAAQALNQMLYNNLTKERGFVGDPKIITDDDYSLVIDKKIRDKWLISRQFLCLSQPILPEHKKEEWLSLNDEFHVKINLIRHEVMSDSNIKHNDKMMAIYNQAKHFYDKDFRPIREKGQNGVVNFYNDKLKYGKQAMAEFIVNQIGTDFFNSWINGAFSLQQLGAMLTRLNETLTEEQNSLTIAISSANDNVIKATSQIKETATNWSNLNALQKLRIGKSANTLEDVYTKAVIEKFSYMAWGVAYEFAQQLIDSLVNLLTVLKDNIDKVNTEFKKAKDDVEGAVKSRCATETEDEESHKGTIIKYYDADKVRHICVGAIQQDANESRIRNVRIKLAERLASDKQNFKEAGEKLKCGDIKQLIEQIVMQQATDFFEDVNETKNIPQFEQMLGVNIVEKLRDEFSGNDEGLKAKLKRLVDHAAIMAKLKTDEVEISDGSKIRKSMFIVIPKYDKDQAFLARLKDIIISLAPASGECKVSEGGNINEIIVMNLEANITPRYLSIVENLRNKFDNLMTSKTADIARFETQLEDYEKPLPKLFFPTEAEKKEQREHDAEIFLPYLLLAKAMGIISLQEDPKTGLEKLIYIPEDVDGLPDLKKAVVLDKTIEKSFEKLDIKKVEVLIEVVKTKLLSDYRHVDKQEIIRNTILDEVKGITIKNGVMDPISQKFTVAYKKVKAMFEEMNEK